MRLILWTLGSLLAAAGLCQITVEAILAVLGESWTRIFSLSDVLAIIFPTGATRWMPGFIADAPPWILALALGAALLYLGRYRRPTRLL